ncbi:MAG: hypothetical protein ACXAC5_25030 [Promethearchaeota archaeon]|jgi:hypothetical protein
MDKKYQKTFKKFCLLLALSILNSCAFSQEGSVDYRKADLLTKERRDQINKDISENKLPDKNGMVAPVRLIRKGSPSNDETHSDSVVREGDSITIRMRQGFISQFWEIPINPFRSFRPNGEIAVLVQAFEFNGDDTTKDFDFGPGGIEKGRLVFFSNDVEENQFLNFDNMPIYGPISYKGNPIGIDIAVIEIDSNSEQMNALLDTLATAGGQAFPPTAPILSILDELGGSLLTAGTNDIEMRFALALDPPNGYRGLYYPRVEAGDYVFIREQDRQTDTDWANLELDANNGRLYQLTKNSTPILYRDNSYMVIQINKGFDSEDIDLSENTFSKFLDRINEEDTRSADALQPFLDEIGSISYSRVQKRNFIRARGLLYQFIEAKKEGNSKAAKRAAFDLHQIFMTAAIELKKDENGAKKATISSERFEWLMRRLREEAKAEVDLNYFTLEGFNKDSSFSTLLSKFDF